MFCQISYPLKGFLRQAHYYGIIDIQFNIKNKLIDGLILPICINNEILRNIIINYFKNPKNRNRCIVLDDIDDIDSFRLFIAYLCYEKVLYIYN